MKFLNLDKFVPEDVEIQLNGKKYRIPGSTSVEIMLKILRNAQKLSENPTDPEATEEAFRTMWEIFRIYQPELEFEDFCKNLTIEQYTTLVNFLYTGKEEIISQQQEQEDLNPKKNIAG